MKLGLAYAAALPLLVLPCLAMGQTAPPPQKTPVLTFTGSIPLPQVDARIDHTSIDLTGQRLFVSAFGNNALEVIDLKTGKVVNEVKSVNKPQNSYYVASVNRLFVASQGDGTVKIFVARPTRCSERCSYPRMPTTCVTMRAATTCSSTMEERNS